MLNYDKNQKHTSFRAAQKPSLRPVFHIFIWKLIWLQFQTHTSLLAGSKNKSCGNRRFGCAIATATESLQV